jgi:hypothetical protein
MGFHDRPTPHLPDHPDCAVDAVVRIEEDVLAPACILTKKTHYSKGKQLMKNRLNTAFVIVAAVVALTGSLTTFVVAQSDAARIIYESAATTRQT